MRVLVISFFNSWVTHFGTELEIAQRHLDDGDTLEFLGCNGCVSICDGNPWASGSHCDACREKRHNGLLRLRPVPVQHNLGRYLSTDFLSRETDSVRSVVDANAAKSYTVNGHDLGWAALSSSIMTTRDTECTSDEAVRLLKEFTKSAYRSYHAVLNFLGQQSRFDRVYIFNGRFAPTRGALRACQEFGVSDIQVHERGSTIESYELFGNSLPHKHELWDRRIKDAWDSAADMQMRDSIGKQFFEDSRGGTPVGWKSYITGQSLGQLPDGWDRNKTNVAIFNSSEDEFAGLGDEWKNPVYEIQSRGIERIVSESLEQFPNMHFYLRVHPNLTNVQNAGLTRLLSFQSPNFSVILPDSPISTYSLMDAADKVLSFGSTVGIEATYWGKVSILAGRCFYENLDAAHVANSHAEVMSLLAQDLLPCSRTNALKYGYYMRTFGYPFKYWEPSGFEAGTFRGFPIGETRMTPQEREFIFWLQDYGIDTRYVPSFLRTAVLHAQASVAGVQRSIAVARSWVRHKVLWPTIRLFRRMVR